MTLKALHHGIWKYLYGIFAITSVLVILMRPVDVDAYSDVIVNDTLNVLLNLSCETQGAEDIFTTEYARSCTPEALSSMLIGSIISPGIYLATMLRLKIGFDGLDYTKGNCTRPNRANNKNPTISFGMCSNIQLVAYRVVLMAEFVAGVGHSSALSVIEQLSGISPDYSKYHTSFIDKQVGDNGIFYDLPIGSIFSFSPVIPWHVTRNNDRICVSTYTIFGTLLEVGCKYIQEPYPVSLYQGFFDNGVNTHTQNTNIANPEIPDDVQQFFACSTAGGCSQTATENAQALKSISSVIIECIRSTLLSTLISNTTCGITNGGIVYGGNMFHDFQKNMQRAVMAFLTLYVIFTGFKLILAQGDVPPAGEFMMYALKVILVIYFSVGININGKGSVDGMTQWIFPLLLDLANEMSSWIAGATPSGLCVFTNSDYIPGMSRMALWDTLDCKVMHYLGFDTLSSLLLGGSAGDNLGHSVPPYIFLLIPALISGQINLVMLALSYPLIVMSVAAYLVTTFAICLIAITVLAVLAPIYVPFLLFEQTKGYFESWWKLMFSFTLQPVVIVGFMTVMFAIFDQGFYTDCEFEGIVVEHVNNGNLATKRLFVLQTDPTQYSDYNAPISKKYNTCTSSLGWILNEPLAHIANAAVASSAGGGGQAQGAKVITVPPPPLHYSDYQSSYASVNAIEQVAGVFMGYVSLISNINKQMIINLFACMLMLYLMRELSGQMSEFAADISGGVSLRGSTISPRSMTGNKLKAKMQDYKDNKTHKNLDKREAAIKAKEGEKGDKGSKGDDKDAKGGSARTPSGSSASGAPRAPISTDSSSGAPQRSTGHSSGGSEA